MREIEDLSELGDTPAAIAERWIEEIDAAEKEWAKYHKRVEKIVKRYVDEREDSLLDQPKKLNILWSNTETVKPALYNKTPVPEVGRRNLDKDPVGREASDVLERSLSFCLDSYDFDGIIRDSVHDFTLGALGQARVVYDPTFASVEGTEELEGEYAKVDYVHWSDFMTNVARSWTEVRWQSFRQFLTRAQLKKLSPKYGALIELDHTPEEMKDDGVKESLFKKARVYEIWDKESGLVYYISKSFKEAPISVQKPFCQFGNFFPAPKPMMGVRGKTIIPQPDYALYQDQAEVIDDLTNKIYTLTKALKVAGVYNGKFKDLQRLVEDGGNTLIAVDSWETFAQTGGMQGNISWMPVEEVAKALISLYEARKQAKADLYESTGISDIVRGASDPNETATAQSIKNQWGSLRIRDKQKEVQRFARDLMRLKGEVIAEHFSLETLKQMSGVQLLSEQEKQILQVKLPSVPPEQQQEAQEQLQKPSWDQVYALLRNDRLRSFSVNIETDSTMEPDAAEAKQSRIEFVQALGGFFQQAGPVIQIAPETARMFGEVLNFAVRGFPVASGLESIIDSTMEQVEQRLSQPQQPDNSEAMAKAETEKQKLALDAQKSQTQAQIDLKKHQDSMALEAQKHKDEITLEAKKHYDMIALEMEKLKASLTMESQKVEAQKQTDKKKAVQEWANSAEDSEVDEVMVGVQRKRQERAQKSQQEAQGKERDSSERQVIAQAAAGIAQSLNALTDAVQAPKQVVRDKDGKVSGVK